MHQLGYPSKKPNMWLTSDQLEFASVLNILLQVADLTGELMRLAIGRISDGELEFAEKICRFVRDIYTGSLHL
ncbi:hypothetical protein JHK87_002612 [Glycine soja]|nr:hypothetical protein JHK87_002612 [Glycine soja]